MFAKPATGSGNSGGTSGKGRGVRFGRRYSRVRGLPEFFGELPVVCLAEEIETPGDRQVRALLTLAGNPAVSTPDAERLDRALSTLEFMVSVDIYLNETTRHANVFLPAEPELTRGHYDVALYNLASATSRTTRRRCSSSARARCPSGRSCCGWRRSSAAKGPTPTSARSTTS
jgi:hypothetical protein